MSVNDPSPPVQGPAPHSVNSFSVNSIVTPSSNNVQPSVLVQSVPPPTNKLSTASPAASAVSEQQNLQDSKLVVTKTTTASLASSTACTSAVQQNKVLPPAALISISAPSRTTTALPSKPVYGMHHLPVRTITTVSHALPRAALAATTAESTTPSDPGGGFVTKPIGIQPALLPAALAVKSSKATQHIFMAPGLRTPLPSLKHHQPYSPNYAYQLSSQPQITTVVSESRQAGPVSTSRTQQPLLMRPQPSRTLVPLAVATTPETTRLPTRSTHVLQQPISTISISIPGKPSGPHDITIPGTSRLTITSSQVGKTYQFGITQPSATVSTQPSASSKPPRIIASSTTVPSRSLATTTMSTVNASLSAFTYTATRPPGITTITTSAIPVAKIYSQQPQAKIQSPASGITAHVRTSEFHPAIAAPRPAHSIAVTTTTHSVVSVPTVITSLAAARTTSQSVLHPLLYWPQSSIGISPPLYAPPYGVGSNTARPPLSVSVSGNTQSDSQNRINAPALFSMNTSNRVAVSNTNVATFTQGQPLLTVSTTMSGKDQSHIMPHLQVTMASGSPHNVPNASPKPAILRRPPRNDASISKKLVFEGGMGRMSPLKPDHRLGTDNSVEQISKARYGGHNTVYPINIKPELGGQVNFSKPVVTSNGLPPTGKLTNSTVKDYRSSPFNPASLALAKDYNVAQVSHRGEANINDLKIKTDAAYQLANIKHEQDTGRIPPFHPYTALKPQEGSSHLHQTTNKPRQIQQRPGHIAPAPALHPRHPTSTLHLSGTPGNPMPRFGSPNALHHKDFTNNNNRMGPVVLKREYSKISDPYITPEPQKHTLPNSITTNDSSIGLSPRKKPRKQTHIVAEELPDTEKVIDDEMSTDDADECEDEVPRTSQPSNVTLTSKKTYETSSSTSSCSASQSVTTVTTRSPTPSDPVEYVDKDGVRYVAVRERPPINLLSGHRSKTLNSHFTHYSDVKVKEKKTSLSETSYDEKRLRGWKILQFAAQLEELASLDADILRRIEVIKEGLLQHDRSLLSNGNPDPGCLSPSHMAFGVAPHTPCSTPSQTLGLPSFAKTLPSSCKRNSSSKSSPLTPIDGKDARVHDSILKVEDIAQANIQRCALIQEQLDETKCLMLKVLECGQFANKVVLAVREAHKANKSNLNGSRYSKKKKS